MRTIPRQELKPCPFCGISDQYITKKILVGGTSLYRVECGYCLACGPWSCRDDRAAAEWNERSGEDDA